MERLFQLNFPRYVFRLRMDAAPPQIWDGVRKRWLVLTPEEWVRQHLIRFLVEEKGAFAACVSQERPVELAGTRQRADVTVTGRTAGSVWSRNAKLRTSRSTSGCSPRRYVTTACWRLLSYWLRTGCGMFAAGAMRNRGATALLPNSPTCHHFFGFSSCSMYSSCQSDVVFVHSFLSPITENPLLLNSARLWMFCDGMSQYSWLRFST